MTGKRRILATQSGAGEFTAHELEPATGKLDDPVSKYYPGEAALALIRGSRLASDRARSTSATVDSTTERQSEPTAGEGQGP